MQWIDDILQMFEVYVLVGCSSAHGDTVEIEKDVYPFCNGSRWMALVSYS